MGHDVEIAESGPVMTIEVRDELTRYHALVALASGVTTINCPDA